MTCRRWTTTTCAAAGRPATRRTMRRRRSWWAMRCSRWHSSCSRAIRRYRPRRQCACASIELLSEASGTFGMAGGQAIDLEVQGRQLDIAQVEDMHARKTGAVIRASVLMAAVCAPQLPAAASMPPSSVSRPRSAWHSRSRTICSMCSATSSTLGKATGADGSMPSPPTRPSSAIAASQQRVHLLHSQALEALVPFGERAAPLRSLAHWLLSRHY